MLAQGENPFALDLRVEVGGVKRRRVAFPWSLGRAYASENWAGAFRLIPQVAGAGMLSGDFVRQRLSLGPGACLRLESAGAMQVLAGDRGPARVEWHYNLGPGATLILDAEPFVLMRRAHLDLRSLVHMSPGASVLAADMVCHSHDDPVAFGQWRTETSVVQGNALSFTDRQSVLPESGARVHSLPDRSSAFGTIWCVGPIALAAQTVAEIEGGSCPIAVTPLRAGAGYALRVAAPDGGTLRSVCRRVLMELERRLVAHQAASWCREAEIVAQT